MTAETFLDGRVTLHCGDSRDVLRTLPDASISATAGRARRRRSTARTGSMPALPPASWGRAGTPGRRPSTAANDPGPLFGGPTVAVMADVLSTEPSPGTYNKPLRPQNKSEVEE